MKSSTTMIIFSAAMLLFSAAAAQAQARDTQKSPATVEAIFKSLDRDRDRSLSKIEAKENKSIWTVFNMADINLDGYITKPEYTAYLERSAAPATSREQPAQ
jgi:hypothetical protein